MIGVLAAVACASTALAQMQTGRRLFSPEAASACAKSGGVVKPAGLFRDEYCIHTFADAGKSCAGGQECASGACLASATVLPGVAVNGTCAADDDIFGCKSYVENGTVDKSMCVD